MSIDDQDYHNCDHTGCCGSKVETFKPLDTSAVSLERIANELARLNANLEKLLPKEPYSERTYIPVMVNLTPEAIQKLATASLKK